MTPATVACRRRRLGRWYVADFPSSSLDLALVGWVVLLVPQLDLGGYVFFGEGVGPVSCGDSEARAEEGGRESGERRVRLSLPLSFTSLRSHALTIVLGEDSIAIDFRSALIAIANAEDPAVCSAVAVFKGEATFTAWSP